MRLFLNSLFVFVFELFQSYMQVALAIDEYIPYVPKDTSVVTDQELQYQKK